MEDILKVGIISSVHGVHGEVKVYPTTDDVKRFKKLKEVLLETKDGLQPLTITGVKFFKQFAILHFAGYDTPEAIGRHKGQSLYVRREDAVPLKKDEYYIADLLGMRICNEQDEDIGVLSDVIENTANDVYVIALTDGRELLLPAIKQCVLDVDVSKNRMKVHILEGLL